MKQGATVYLYELAWILPSIAIPVGMLAALLVTAFGAGIHVPSVAGRIDPTRVTETAPFDQPGVVQTGPVSYEVRMIGQTWAFTPNEIRVPVGSTVTFVVATSKDVMASYLQPEWSALLPWASPPEDGPVILNRLRPWVITAVVFLVAAYGPTLARLVATSRLNAPGFRVW